MSAHLRVWALCLALMLPFGNAIAQEPLQQEPPSITWHRDITPYVIGLGAVMGVIAFNIAAPPVVDWGGAAVRSVRNIATVATVAGLRVRSWFTGIPVAVVVTQATATTAAPIVTPLTQSMLAQAQITGTAAAAAGVTVFSLLYSLYHTITGTAP
ncbi:MAG: hypothetical protein WCK65_03465 [Rhodospirillaceae bacterium]